MYLLFLLFLGGLHELKARDRHAYTAVRYVYIAHAVFGKGFFLPAIPPYGFPMIEKSAAARRNTVMADRAMPETGLSVAIFAASRPGLRSRLDRCILNIRNHVYLF